jgi:hypothetical protein
MALSKSPQALADHPHLTRDGHLLRINGLDGEGYLRLEVVCNPETCRAKWADIDADGTPVDLTLVAKEPCWLRYWISEDDAWRESLLGTVDGTGPFALAWWWNGEYVELLMELVA